MPAAETIAVPPAAIVKVLRAAAPVNVDVLVTERVDDKVAVLLTARVPEMVVLPVAEIDAPPVMPDSTLDS